MELLEHPLNKEWKCVVISRGGCHIYSLYFTFIIRIKALYCCLQDHLSYPQ